MPVILSENVPLTQQSTRTSAKSKPLTSFLSLYPQYRHKERRRGEDQSEEDDANNNSDSIVIIEDRNTSIERYTQLIPLQEVPPSAQPAHRSQTLRRSQTPRRNQTLHRSQSLLYRLVPGVEIEEQQKQQPGLTERIHGKQCQLHSPTPSLVNQTIVNTQLQLQLQTRIKHLLYASSYR